WGRFVCPSVWNFDTECITSNGSYVSIVKRLCEISGDAEYLKDISDYVNLEYQDGWLKYKVNGLQRDWIIEVNDDWADMIPIGSAMDDIERDGKHFYFKYNGQAMVLFYLDENTATEINKLSNDALKLVLIP
ncbi:MAG: hypothetical protein ACI86H_003026, partial [bacterium]